MYQNSLYWLSYGFFYDFRWRGHFRTSWRWLCVKMFFDFSQTTPLELCRLSGFEGRTEKNVLFISLALFFFLWFYSFVVFFSRCLFRESLATARYIPTWEAYWVKSIVPLSQWCNFYCLQYYFSPPSYLSLPIERVNMTVKYKTLEADFSSFIR